MTLAALKASLALWRRRLAYRQARHEQYHAERGQRPEPERVELAKKWHALEQQARDMVERRKRQIRARAARPPIVTAGQLGLTFRYLWGAKGDVYRGAGHYTAGPRATGRDDLIRLVRQYHAQHPGGLAYEAVVADDGTIALINPIDRKGAAVALNNTGMVNICCPGTTGDRLTDAQQRSVHWLLDHWHTRQVPKAHRLPKQARPLDWRGHKDHPQQSTLCPGDMLPDYKECWR